MFSKRLYSRLFTRLTSAVKLTVCAYKALITVTPTEEQDINRRGSSFVLVEISFPDCGYPALHSVISDVSVNWNFR